MRLCFIIIVLIGLMAGVETAKASVSLVPAISNGHSFSVVSPTELIRKATQAFNDFKEGLHPVLVVLLYAGLLFVVFIASIFIVIIFFLVIMMAKR